MNLLRFFIYSNIVISLSAGALAGACATKLGNPHNFGIGITVFFATLFIYNIQRVFRHTEVSENFSARHQWIQKHLIILKVFSGIGIVGSIATYFFWLGWNIDFWFLAISAIIGVLYAYQITPKWLALRDIPYIKIYLIASQWALTSVYWPYMRIADSIDFPIALGLSVFTLILAITIPFDIRDIVYDQPTKKTIPQLVGIQKAKWIAIMILGISAFTLYSFEKEVVHSFLFYSVYIVFAFLILFSSTQKEEMYFSGWIDGWIIIYAFLIYLN